MKAGLFLAGALFLAACAAVRTPEQAVFAATTTYLGALGAVNVYAEAPPCGPGERPSLERLCRTEEVDEKVAVAVETASAALDLALDIVRDDRADEQAARRAADSAAAAVRSLVGLLQSFGIMGGK